MDQALVLQELNKVEEDYCNRASARNQVPFRPWTAEEHTRFLEAVRTYREDLVGIGSCIPTRTFSEVVQHVKFFTAISLTMAGAQRHPTSQTFSWGQTERKDGSSSANRLTDRPADPDHPMEDAPLSPPTESSIKVNRAPSPQQPLPRIVAPSNTVHMLAPVSKARRLSNEDIPQQRTTPLVPATRSHSTPQFTAQSFQRSTGLRPACHSPKTSPKTSPRTSPTTAPRAPMSLFAIPELTTIPNLEEQCRNVLNDNWRLFQAMQVALASGNLYLSREHYANFQRNIENALRWTAQIAGTRTLPEFRLALDQPIFAQQQSSGTQSTLPPFGQPPGTL